MSRMSQLETGLRHRLRRGVRQMATQHRQLRALHQALAEAIASERAAAARDCVERLRSAVEAHFSLEEGVFFPAVHGLHPESAPELNALTREHDDFLAALSQLDELLARGAAPAALDAFAAKYRAFSETIAEHERREEQLVASLTQALDAIG
jgi:hemerythrin-like domain-containing protein